MKIRRQAEDFQVNEQSTLPIGAQGPFAVYRLTKTHWTTLDALDRIAREINLPRRHLVHAGLKDRHACTSQLITIRHGPRRDFESGEVSLCWLGQSPREISSSDIAANAFTIVVRSLTPVELQAAMTALDEVRQGGLVNYFDDQRFGSWRAGQGFIAEAWIREQYEVALKMTFAEPEPHDDRTQRREKAILREHWGDWQTCKSLLQRSHRRSIVTYLCDHPQNFKGAWSRVNADWRGLFLSALQSDLWNQAASLFLEQKLAAGDRFSVDLKTGPVQFARSLPEEMQTEWKDLRIPLPSARIAATAGEWTALFTEALARRGWTLGELKVRFPRDRFFSRGLRSLLLPVAGLTGEAATDELDPARSRLTLQFSLPRGAYATMLIKRLFGAEFDGESDSDRTESAS